MVLPTYTCREAVITNAVKASVNGISACAPVDSDVSVTLNVCASEQTIWLAWINQIKVAFCYLFGQVTDILASLITIDTEITDLQTQVDTIESELPATHVGTPTFAIDPTMGAGASYTLLPGSSDVQGGVVITLGNSPTPGGGPAGILTFGLQFDNQIYPVTGAYPPISASHAFSTGWQLPPGPGPANTPVTAMTLMIGVDTADFIIEGDVFVITWHVGFNAPIP